jgi:SAM-dependent methyltransferase
MSSAGATAATATSSPPRCRCCGSTNLVLRGRKRGEFIRREFEFFACRDCELLFVEPFSGFEIYNDAYYRGAGPDPYVDYETEYRDWRRSDRGLEFRDLLRLAERHLARLPERRPPAPQARPSQPRTDRQTGVTAPVVAWLDFGCGAGGFLKFLRERGRIDRHVLAVEGHDVGSYAEMLKTVDGFRILDRHELSREPDARYDIISMIEVIEHLPEPRAALALVARLLKPGGLLLLTTGNLDNPVARRQGIHYRYCAPEIHVSLFNPSCLARLYRAVGLEPVQVRYRGAVQFKVVKSLRHRPVLRACARFGLMFPPVTRVVDWLYGVSAMPCALKRS